MAISEARLPALQEDRPTQAPSSGSVTLAVHAGPSPPPLLVSLGAGALAGALAKTVIAPLDRTKINFQVSERPYSWRAASRFVRETVRREGVTSLWRGNSATMARIVPYAAVQFAAHERWKRALGVDSPASASLHPWRHLAAGSLAGVTSQSATYPLDVARARMAVGAAQRSLAAVLAGIVAREGVRTLYRGYPATVLGVIPYAGVSFYTYDTLKQRYLEWSGAAAGGWARLACGGVAGALGQTASYPLDMVRRRMQTGERRADGSYPYRTIGDTLRQVYRSEGVRGFFKGLSMNWVKGPLAVGVSFATYDHIKRQLCDLLAVPT